MKLISIKTHGMLDYLTVIGFILIPLLLKLSGTPAYVSYAVAAVHFLMTVLTSFPMGIIKMIPIAVHKIVEAVVGPVLVICPWVLGFASLTTARNFFILAGVVIFLVWALSQYHDAQRSPVLKQ